MMRLLSTVVCALALVTVTSGIASASGQSVAKDEYCTFKAVRDASIHTRPGTQHPVIGQLSAGQTVTALRRPLQGFHLLSPSGYVVAANLQLVDEPARCGG